MTTVIERTFAGGRISPALAARSDVVKYQSGVRELLNFEVQRFGGVRNRAGFQFGGITGGQDATISAAYSTQARMIPWQFSDDLTYALEFGTKNLTHSVNPTAAVGYVRFWTDCARLGVGETYAAYNGATNYSKGQAVSYSGRNFSSKTDGNTGNTPPTANFLGDANWHLMPSDGTYEIFSPYSTYADIADLQFAQSASVLTIVHPSYAPRDLIRDDTYQWGFDTISFSGGVFGSTDNYPSTVTYSQQRKVYAASNNEPEKVWMSKVDDFTEFTVPATPADDDPVIFTIAGTTVNRVRHLAEIAGKLVILTTGAEWTVRGDAAGIVTPSSVNLRQEGFRGANTLRPIFIGNTLLYVQARGYQVRDFSYDFGSDGYRGNDLTIFANDLFDKYTLLDWSYAQTPHSLVWAVRSDGRLLSLTYIPEHDVWGWAQHTTGAYDEDGVSTREDDFTSVCTIPEGTQDRLYSVVKRTINSNTVYYVERLAVREFTDITEDAYFLDSYLTYDGRNTSADTVTLSTSGGWTVSDAITVTASGTPFGTVQAGDWVKVWSGTTEVRIIVTTPTSSAVVSGNPSSDVPAALRSTALTTYSVMEKTVTGLSHLEGESVSVMNDGNVESLKTVSSGSVTLSNPGSIVHVGLPITSDFETLDLDDPQGETLLDKKKLVRRVFMYVEESRGIFSGPDADHLTEYKQRANEDWGDPIQPYTGPLEFQITGRWQRSARIYVRQVDPLPLTILAVAPRLEIGG